MTRSEIMDEYTVAGFAVADAWLTTSGQLVTTRYGEQFQHGDFCVETTTTGTIVAVMCNPCGGKVRMWRRVGQKLSSVLGTMHPSLLSTWSSLLTEC